MPNIATALRDEIRRLAKREINATTQSTKQAVAQHRRDIAMLKRLVQAQHKEIRFLRTQESKRLNHPPTAAEPVQGVRYSARSVRAQRQRLGLSAEDFAKLVGVSGLTIYNWEHGKARPRTERLAALFALRHVGKREALKKLEMLKGPPRATGRSRRPASVSR
jgi:DNA-binding transcriptional regulator YiaG